MNIPSFAFSERGHTLTIFTRGFKAFILSHADREVSQNLGLPFTPFWTCFAWHESPPKS